MDVDAAEVVDLVALEEEVKDAAGAEVEAEDEVTTPIHYLVHMVMELLFLELRYMIKVNINHCPEIKKLQTQELKSAAGWINGYTPPTGYVLDEK